MGMRATVAGERLKLSGMAFTFAEQLGCVAEGGATLNEGHVLMVVCAMKSELLGKGDMSPDLSSLLGIRQFESDVRAYRLLCEWLAFSELRQEDTLTFS